MNKNRFMFLKKLYKDRLVVTVGYKNKYYSNGLDKKILDVIDYNEDGLNINMVVIDKSNKVTLINDDYNLYRKYVIMVFLMDFVKRAVKKIYK